MIQSLFSERIPVNWFARQGVRMFPKQCPDVAEIRSPESAINYKNKTQNRGRYHRSDIRFEEMCKKSALFSLLRKMAPILMGHAVRDILKLGEVVTASNLDWTIIRILNPNMKSSGKGYKLAVGSEKHKMSVSRENVANSLYDVAKSNGYVHQMPIVFNK